MEVSHIRELIRLKKRRLIHINILFLLLVPLATYAGNHMSGFRFVLLFTIIVWIAAAYYLFLYFTGKKIGLNSWVRHDELERFYQGERKWKRNKVKEIVFIISLAVAFTIFYIVFEFDS
ncbi:hypothetical protein [Salimicrobium halophilum]|uniref:Uncharacterized protein n=1 Tax=Salimicrobium halophilum TaxID=86666 RepID=A0A1G8RHY1_9BACI|nr:hypothetical protein [Salimicrobium halophilum]SDJ16473.1 hypothetical protein SAMN04490247_1040 [Salimicrobium halophilum]